MAHVIPNGREKDTPLVDASDEGIKFWWNRKTSEVAEDPSGRWTARNISWLTEARSVMVARGADPADYVVPELSAQAQNGAPPAERQAGPAPSNGAPKNGGGAKPPARERASFHAGSFVDAARLQDALEAASKDYFIIGGMTVGELPVGHSVMATIVKIDPAVKGATYDVAGGTALSKVSINDLAEAAGVSDVASQLLAYDPAGMCSFKFRVARQSLSGQPATKEGTKIIDLRKGSTEYDLMYAAGVRRRQLAISKKWDNIPDPDDQINQILLHLPAHTASKARLIAIRNLLSLRSYPKAELEKKAFICLRLHFTGKSDNPEIAKIFAMGLMQAALAPMTALFGNASSGMQGLGGGGFAPQLPAPPVMQSLPESSVIDHPQDHEGDDDDIPY